MARLQGDIVETTLTTNSRDYEAGFRRAAQTRDRFVAETNRAFAGIGTGAGGGLLPGLSNISNIIQALPQIGGLANALVSPLRRATEEGIRFNMMIESAEMGFVGVSKGIEGARKHVEALRRFGEDSPLFDTRGLIRTSQLMNVFGFQLSEHIPKIRIWGDAIASQGEMSEETLLGVARAFGQMRAIGRVNAEEMNQLAERGIPGWELLARAIGKTVEETRKLGEQGRLRGPEAVEAITAMIGQDPRFKGTAERQAGTLAGRLARLEEIQGRAQGLATENLTRDISGALEAGLKGEDVAIRMAGSINAAIAPVSGMIKATVVGSIGGGITTGLQEGIEAGKGAVSAAMQSFALDSVINPFKSALGIQSPSKVFMEFGEMAGEGFAQGLRGALKKLTQETGGDLRKYLEGLAQDPRIKAWFEVIRGVEGGAPMRVVGGGSANPLDPRHPGAYGMGMNGPKGWSTAAGNWQITQTNWKALAPLLGLTDFRDVNQQMLAALALFAAEGGPEALLGGDLQGALRASRPWAATPRSHLPGRKPLNSEQFIGRYLSQLNGQSGMRAPVPVTIVGGDGAALSPYGRAEFIKRPVYENGQLVGYDAFDPSDATNLPFSPGLGADRIFGMLTPGSNAAAAPLGGGGNLAQAQFNLLAALGQIGPTIEQGFQQGEAAAGSFYASVVKQTGDAKAFLGITAKDMKGLFEDSFVGAFTRTDLGFKGMVANMVLTFAQGINQMVQQWAASQLSKMLGSLIGSVLGGIGGGLPMGSANPGGLANSLLTISPNPRGFASGTPYAPPGWAMVGETGRELVKLRGGERIYNNRETERMLARPTQVTTVNNYNFNIMPLRPPDNARTRVSQRETLENLLSALR